MRRRNGPIAIAALETGWGLQQMMRRPTARRRVLPDFLIVGAQKAGTTALYHYLQQSNFIRGSSQKEVHYFDHHYHRGALWYRAHFPLAGDERPWRTGEASPYYLLHPQVPQRIAELTPRARIFILLRDPVERAYSHFQHSRAHMKEPETHFERALKLESSRTDEGWQALLAGAPRSRPVEWFSYGRRSVYAPQIRRWQASFDQDQIFVETAERLASDPATIINSALHHLGLPEMQTSLQREVRNARKYPRLEVSLRHRLFADFADDIAETEHLIGKRLHWDAG